MDCLNQPMLLDDSALERYREQGFLRVENALDADYLTGFREHCSAVIESLDEATKRRQMRRDYNESQRQALIAALQQPAPVSADPESDTYSRAFTQVTNLWRIDPLIAELVHGTRLAQIAAELLEADGVRIYHDQALYKSAGGGHTPWHVDQFYWPLAGARTVTAWIPLQPVSPEMGPLAFAPGSQHLAQQGIAGQLAISDESEAQLDRLLAGRPVVDAPFQLGEVSFHNGWTCHRAGPNTTATTRAVFTIIYMATDARMIEPQHRNHHIDAALWLPGVKPGEMAASELNPLVFGC